MNTCLYDFGLSDVVTGWGEGLDIQLFVLHKYTTRELTKSVIVKAVACIHLDVKSGGFSAPAPHLRYILVGTIIFWSVQSDIVVIPVDTLTVSSGSHVIVSVPCV